MSYATSRFKKIKGTREQVWSGTAKETPGGLRKNDLMISKTGTLVSKKASQAAKNRMKSGKGLCEYCIKQYKEGKIKNTPSSKTSTKKKSFKKAQPKLKTPKVTGASEKKVKELKIVIEKLREKAGRIAE